MKIKQHQHYETIAFTMALIFLAIAIAQPAIKVKKEIKDYLIFIDVTQSMNVSDMPLHGKNISRIDYAKHLIKEIITDSPCGTRIGLGIFFKASIALLYTPVEACQNQNLLTDTVDHLEWRMAPRGNSNIRLGLQSIASRLLTLQAPANIIFVTDGDEAPPLNAINKTSLSGWHGGSDWLLIGVGDTKPSPIPKLDQHNKVIGFWSLYSLKVAPSNAVNDGASHARDESYASQPYEYYLSQLDEAYMKELANDINGHYIKADNTEALKQTIAKQALSYHDITPHNLSWLFAIGAFIFILSAYTFNRQATHSKLKIF